MTLQWPGRWQSLSHELYPDKFPGSLFLCCLILLNDTWSKVAVLRLPNSCRHVGCQGPRQDFNHLELEVRLLHHAGPLCQISGKINFCYFYLQCGCFGFCLFFNMRLCFLAISFCLDEKQQMEYCTAHHMATNVWSHSMNNYTNI